MKKNFLKSVLALTMCMVICIISFPLQVSAAGIPYGSTKVNYTNTYTFTINTQNTSGYESTTIGHFSIVTHDFTTSADVTVTVSKNGTALKTAFPPVVVGQEKKLENIYLGNYYSAGTYTISVRVDNMGVGSGWVGVWLFH